MTIEERAAQLSYQAPSIPRLGVPFYNWWNEALHGIARAGTATSFPQAIGMAAMFDDALMRKIADAIASEGRAKYNTYSSEGDRGIYKGLTFWSPNVNIFRDPRWGRGHETYGEDPFLTSRLGVAFIQGLQGDKEILKSAACAKHFAVHSGPENVRHEFNALATKKDMWETYLPAFEACVKEGEVESVMGAYNRTNNEPCCGSYTLIRDILRGKWNFQGHYVSDCWAISDFHMHHGVTGNAKESAALALKARSDLNSGNTYLQILKAYQDGMIKEEDITKATERLFTTRMLLGLFDETEYDEIPYEVVECSQHIDLAIGAAHKGTVLLKNNGLLPLSKENYKTIGVIGPNANSRAALVGNYHGTSSRYITVLEGIQDEVDKEMRVLFSVGSDLSKNRSEDLAQPYDRISEALIVAKNSDVVVLVLGLDEFLEGEESDQSNFAGSAGDKVDLMLPEVQQKLLKKVLEVGKPTIVCLMAGSALDLSYAHENAHAIIQAWYPGARGGKAIADILFGKVSPSGKLPITFYRDLDHMPAFEDYSMTNRTYRYMEEESLYSFGYGLTYSDVNLVKADILSLTAEEIRFEVIIENIGDRDTDEVIQIYIKDRKSKYAVKNHSLCAFKRVELKSQESKSLVLSIGSSALTIVDHEGNRFIDSDSFTLFVGTSQPDARSIHLTGKEPIEVDFHFDYK
jgi:beta-glucosidase